MARLAVMIACVGVLGCWRHDTQIELGDPRIVHARIAVLPFETGGVLGEGGTIAAIPGAAPVPESVGVHAAVVLEGALRGLGLHVVEQTVVDRAVEARGDAPLDVESAGELGEQLAAELVALGVISRYEERRGSALGVEEPATVWYQVALVRSVDGSILGRDQFDYSQKPISANILELGRVMEEGGFGWQTREQILDGALERSAKRLVRGLTRGRQPVSIPVPSEE